MSISSYLCTFLVVGLVLDTNPVKGTGTQDEIADLVDIYDQHVIDKDIDALLEIYHPNVTFIFNDGEPVEGREAFRPLLTDWVNLVYRAEDITTKIQPLGSSYALQLVSVKEFNSADDVTVEGQCVHIWEKTPDGWKLHYDIFNSK